MKKSSPTPTSSGNLARPSVPGVAAPSTPTAAPSSSEQVEVFNGVDSCLVPRCCDGQVLQEEVFHAQAFRYMVAEMKRVSKRFLCAKCGRELPSTIKPERPARQRKPLNIK